MSIPVWQSIFLPLLRMAADGQQHRVKEAIEKLGVEFGLSSQELDEVYPQSGIPVFSTRVRWADVYLTKAGLLEHAERGRFRITGRGRTVLASNPSVLGVKDLEQYDEFREFKRKSRPKDVPDVDQDLSTQPPQEVIEAAYQTWYRNLSEQLLARVHGASPKFFEKLVVDLLVAMGYGGSRKDAGRVIGKTGDEGIDGLIKEDKLGLDVIYIQAKRWQGAVSRKDVQAFAGALDGQRATKGVMITTSRFTDDAGEFSEKSSRKIILIDGERLADLMIEHGIGVSDKDKPAYVLKDVDSDYFEEV